MGMQGGYFRKLSLQDEEHRESGFFLTYTGLRLSVTLHSIECGASNPSSAAAASVVTKTVAFPMAGRGGGIKQRVSANTLRRSLDG